MLLIYGHPSDPCFLRHVLNLRQMSISRAGWEIETNAQMEAVCSFPNARNCWCTLELCQCLCMLTHKCAESAKLSSFSLSACGLKDFIVIACFVCFMRSKFKLSVSSNCKEKIGVFWKCAESSFCVLAPCKHFPWIACHCKAVNQLSFFFLFSALIKSDLRRHNVNSGIMNLDVKAVSGDSFTIIVLPTGMLDFYWQNNISWKRVLDKVLWLVPCWFWTTEPHGMLLSHIFFSP